MTIDALRGAARPLPPPYAGGGSERDLSHPPTLFPRGKGASKHTPAVRGIAGRIALLGLVALLAPTLAGCNVAAPPRETTSDTIEARPWVPGERYDYAVSDGRGNVVGQGVLTTTRDGDGLVLEQRYVEANPAAGGAATSDTIVLTVDASTLRPRAGRRETQRRDAAGALRAERTAWRYADLDGVTRLTTQRERDGSAAIERTIVLRAHASDNEASLWAWRALAFAEGYARSYVAADPHEPGQQTVSLRVPRREPMTVPAGTFSTWRVILRSGRAVRTAWVNVDAPHQIVRWDNGDLVFELTKSELPR